MDHRTACDLLILCHFRQCALARERVCTVCTWMHLLIVLGALDVGCGAGTENNLSRSLSLTLVSLGVPGHPCSQMVIHDRSASMPPFHVSLRLHLFLEGSQGDARIQIMTRQSQVSFFFKSSD